MLVLTRPALDDVKTLARLGKDIRFAADSAVWTQAYADYDAAGGDPWIVAPAVFSQDIADLQRALYDTRRKTGPLERIRRRSDFNCCPMCGSGGRGHLDHFLPRVAYPEFSVFGLNLVPACPSCNSSNKGETFRGDAPERFLHPYFDTIASSAIWFVEITGDLRAAQFSADVMPGLAPDDARRVLFHLANVLGWEFSVWVGNFWADLPQWVRDARDSAASISAADAREDLERLYRQTVGAVGRNSWPAALLRGVLKHPTACEHLADKALSRIVTRI